MLDQMTREMFEPLIGQKFQVTLPDSQVVDFELIDVEELPVGRRRRNAPTPRRMPFSLFFQAAPRLEQAMYPMRHELFGGEQQEIFIVPVGQLEGGYEYEAVFT